MSEKQHPQAPSWTQPTGQAIKVAVAMSGGVDSSVAAALLKEQGYDVIGLHLSFWKDPTVFSDEEVRNFPQNRCCSVASLEDARKVAAHIGIPFYVLNFREKFKEKVVDYFVSGYEQGETPNPCVTCNREMKFGALLERAKQLGATYLASGHYARVEKVGDTYKLFRAKDQLKDQSYFLYHLGQEKLSGILFPLGNLTKEEVYAKAQDLGLPVPEKKESQGICFIPDKKNVNFLKRHMSKTALQHGPIKDINGKVYLEQHGGLSLYTIGQREGLQIGGAPEPLYVVGFDVPNNTLLIGRNSDVFKQTLQVRQIQFTTDQPLPGFTADGAHVEAMIRYRFAPRGARLKQARTNEFSLASSLTSDTRLADVVFDEPVRAVTPGQSVVFYSGEEVVGGGIIA